MLSDTIAERYAEALFMLGQAKGTLTQFDGDLRKAIAIIDGNPRLARALEAPYVPAQVKMNIARRMLQDRVDPVVVNFFLLLVHKGRERFSRAIAAKFQEMLEEREGVVACRLESPFPLSEASIAEVSAWIVKRTGRRPRLEVTVNPALIAGLVVRIKDRSIDLSLQGQLKAMEKSLLHV